jgi:hypothetical protein
MTSTTSLSRFLEWLKSLFYKKSKGEKSHVRIIEEIKSPISRTIRINRDYPGAVDTWKSIPMYESAYDFYCLVDRTKREEMGRDNLFLRAGNTTIRVRADPRSGLGGDINSSHRITIVGVSRLPIGKGQYQTEVLYVGLFNLVKSFNSYDSVAKVLAHRIAKKMSVVIVDNMDWCTFINDEKNRLI